MAQKAKCPYCGGYHSKKAAFNRCKKAKGKWKWTKDGNKVLGGK